MATSCIETILFGQVCDSCDGGAILKIVAFGIKLFTAGVLVAATIGLIIVGIRWMTARENADQVARAKKRFLEIVIGIGVYALMFVIANFLIPGGIVASTTDSTTTSCPDAPTVATTTSKSGGTSGPTTSNETPTEGKYPWATLAGQASAGSIQCPRNANYTYTANPNGKYDQYDKFFQAKASSCPFTKVEYTNNSDDQACAPGSTMHYATIENEKWKSGSIVKETMGPFCLVNSKIDVGQYQHYLVENHISQDNRICMPDGECVDGGENAANGFKEYFCCNYFSYTFAANLNHGEVVSNDVLTSKCGTAFHAAYHRITKSGNKETTWGGRSVTVYDDALTGININPAVFQPLPYPEISTVFSITDTLNTLRQGKAVTVMTRGEGWGHYITAVGFTKDCMIGSTAQCTFNDIVFLNSTYGSSIQVNYAKITDANTPNPNTDHVCTQEKCTTKR